jgi:hypothetical protein
MKARWLKPPTKLFPIPFHGSDFWWSAKFDKTTVVRLVLAPVFTLIAYFLPYPFNLIGFGIIAAFETGIQFANGTGNDNCVGENKCKQAFNLIDWLAVIIFVGGAILI